MAQGEGNTLCFGVPAHNTRFCSATHWEGTHPEMKKKVAWGTPLQPGGQRRRRQWTAPPSAAPTPAARRTPAAAPRVAARSAASAPGARGQKGGASETHRGCPPRGASFFFRAQTHNSTTHPPEEGSLQKLVNTRDRPNKLLSACLLKRGGTPTRGVRKTPGRRAKGGPTPGQVVGVLFPSVAEMLCPKKGYQVTGTVFFAFRLPAGQPLFGG